MLSYRHNASKIVLDFIAQRQKDDPIELDIDSFKLILRNGFRMHAQLLDIMYRTDIDFPRQKPEPPNRSERPPVRFHELLSPFLGRCYG